MVVDTCIPKGAALVAGSLETCQLGTAGHVGMAYSYLAPRGNWLYMASHERTVLRG